MSIATKAKKVCKSIKKPMSIPSKTRKDQKAHEHSSNPCQKVLKPMSIASKTLGPQPRPEQEMLEWRPPALTNTPLSHAHTASPRPLARTHDTNTKRNRNRFPDWGSPASIHSPQSPIYLGARPFAVCWRKDPRKDGGSTPSRHSILAGALDPHPPLLPPSRP